MTEKLKVKEIIGTGDPFDMIALIPLLHDWKVPEGCIGGVRDGEECNATATRIYVLAEPFQGFNCVRACERHHQELFGADDD